MAIKSMSDFKEAGMAETSDGVRSEQVLACPMDDNDAGAATVKDYLLKLLHAVWDEEEGFDGKRPFGNSGWQYEVYAALGKAGYITCTLDEDGYVQGCDDEGADELILAAIGTL